MLQFSLANCVERFLQRVSSSTGREARGYIQREKSAGAETDTDSDSDCELALS